MATKQAKAGIRVSLPISQMTLLQQMAEQREMTVDALTSELVQIGLFSLRGAPPKLEDQVLAKPDLGWYTVTTP